MSTRLLLPLAGLVLLAAAIPPGPVGDDTARAKELIRAMVGTWDSETSFGNFPPSKGTETVTLSGGGLAAVVTSTSAMGPGMTFEGHGLFGFDPQKHVWFNVWADNTSPGLGVSEGNWSADGKTFTIEEEIDMGTGPQKMLMVTVLTGADSREFTMQRKDAAPDADPVLSMKYKRHAP